MNKFSIKGEKGSLRIKDAADHLFEKLNDLIDRPITWNNFTKDYMKFYLPKSKIDNILWRGIRPTWVEAINKEFVRNRRPCKLHVVNKYGVQLMTDGQALLKDLVKRGKKQINTSTKTIETCKDAKISFTKYPEIVKAYEIWERNIEENTFALAGRVENSKLPDDVKLEFKKIIQKSLPQDE